MHPEPCCGASHITLISFFGTGDVCVTAFGQSLDNFTNESVYT